MTLSRHFAACLLVATLAGCEATEETTPKLDLAKANAWMITSIRDSAINNAIVTQRILFPYHFVPDSAGLTELGQRELEVLAEHFEKHQGNLNVRQGGASNDLYKARIRSVQSALVEAGVRNRIVIADALPGGHGMPSEQVLMIIEGRNSPTEPLYYPIGESSSSGTSLA